MDNKQDLQEERYEFPYHYLPSIRNGNFSQHQYWSWGFRYLGRIQIVFDILQKLEFKSLIDIGCGDGRFLRDVNNLFKGKRLLGIDYSETAISIARQMNPDLCYKQTNIVSTSLNDRYDVATLLDVIEHIPLESLNPFMKSVSDLIRPGGQLIISVPHTNEKLFPKHHQHFNSAKLRTLLKNDFHMIRFIPFDHISLLLKLFIKLSGGSGKYFIITHAGMNNLLFRYYKMYCLYGKGEKRCMKIACIARKKSI